MNKLKNLKLKNMEIQKVIGYILLLLYSISIIGVLIIASGLDMLPGKYLLIIGIIMAIFGAVLAIMHEKLVTSVIASVLSVVMIVLSVLGISVIRKTDDMITEVSTADFQTDVISAYVMNEDPAGNLSDIAEYEVGRANAIDTTNTDQAVAKFEEDLGGKLAMKDYETMFLMLDDLKEGIIGAIIINEAYVGIASDVEGYEWAATDLKKVASMEYAVAKEDEPEIPEDVPETFVMYLSGIDTYGGVTARSRSDVNILAVVNTKTKDILLLSTPRDAYVTFSQTGGARDKLTHAGIYGVEASMDALKQLYGIEIDYYLRLNFSGFIDIIDALGGIDVYSEYKFTVKPIKTYEVGMNHLSGIEALAFARERYSFEDGDFQRAKNQMEVIRALVQEAASSSLLTNYSSVMKAVAGSFETSMPQDQIAALVKMQLSDMSQWNIKSYTTGGAGRNAETFSMPGQQLYVIDLDETAVEEAKRLIREVYGSAE
ncbi:LCP family protein [Lachnospiraceae bacterium 50-23]